MRAPGLALLALGALQARCEASPPVEAARSGLAQLRPLAAPRVREQGSACEPGVRRPDRGAVPNRIGSFCLATLSDPRGAEDDGGPRLREACRRLLGTGCGELVSMGLEALYAHHYRDARSGAEVDLLQLRFGTLQQSFAWFSQPAAAATDPLAPSGLWLEAEGQAVSHGDWLVARRGRLGFRLTRDDSARAPDGEPEPHPLADFATQLLAQSGEPAGLPEAVLRLPERGRIPRSESLQLHDALGIDGLGEAAIAHYEAEGKRWRALVVVHRDPDFARDLVDSLHKRPGSLELPGAALSALLFVGAGSGPGRAPQWVIGRRRNVIYGVGDDPTVQALGLSAKQEDDARLSTGEKLLQLGRLARRPFKPPEQAP